MELDEHSEELKEDTQVIITFLNENEIDLRARGIDLERA